MVYDRRYKDLSCIDYPIFRIQVYLGREFDTEPLENGSVENKLRGALCFLNNRVPLY